MADTVRITGFIVIRTLSQMSLKLEGHNMTLFEADVSVDQTVYTTSNGTKHMPTYSGHLLGPSPH